MGVPSVEYQRPGKYSFPPKLPNRTAKEPLFSRKIAAERALRQRTTGGVEAPPTEGRR